MATSTTISGLPYPQGSDDNNVPSDMAALAGALDGLVIRKLTSVQIAALTAPQRPAGTFFWNTTTDRLMVSNGSAVVDYNSPTYAIGERTSGSQTVSATTATVSYTGETDPDGMLSSGTFTVPSAGLWLVTGNIYNAASPSGSVYLKHGSTQVAWEDWSGYATALSAVIVAVASDTVLMEVTGSGTITAARCSVVRLGS